MGGLLESLNAEQRRAVTTTEGPVLVLAGAGTGKTRVITVRIAHLLRRGVPAEAILAVTFTNKAAREMRERVTRLVGKKKAEALTVGTFHAFCVRLLRAHGERIGIPRDFSICDASDQLAAAKGALRDLHIPEAAVQPRALQAEISLLKSRLQQPSGEGGDREALVARAFERYEDNLRRAKRLDFDDLLLRALELLRRDEPTREALRARYRYLMVDEYQDTNAPQYEIVKTLAGPRRNLCVVGDDDQSIYGWRGADVSKILRFERDFAGSAVVRLETNYRSTEPILDAANAVIRCNPARHEKTLRSHRGAGEPVKVVPVEDEEIEARRVVADIRKRVETEHERYSDIAILFRAAIQSRAFEAGLRACDIPYVLVGGPSFFDRKEVRDVLAFLKLVQNPDDEVSFLRVVNTPPRGVGKTSVDRLLARAAELGVSVPRAIDGADLPAAAAEGLVRLRARLARLDPERGLVRLVTELLDAVDYRAEVDRCYPDPKTRELRWAGVTEVANLAENYARRQRKPTLAGFLEEVALTASDDQTEEPGNRDAVTLMTLHAAKGLEFRRVYLVGVEEGILPHSKSLEQVEEERRLMYVGVTRAQTHLTITHAGERAKFGRRVACMPSRFLFELAGESPPREWRPAGSPERAVRGVKGRRGGSGAAGAARRRARR